jgi:hypothetical protein
MTDGECLFLSDKLLEKNTKLQNGTNWLSIQYVLTGCDVVKVAENWPLLSGTRA